MWQRAAVTQLLWYFTSRRWLMQWRALILVEHGRIYIESIWLLFHEMQGVVLLLTCQFMYVFQLWWVGSIQSCQVGIHGYLLPTKLIPIWHLIQFTFIPKHNWIKPFVDTCLFLLFAAFILQSWQVRWRTVLIDSSTLWWWWVSYLLGGTVTCYRFHCEHRFVVYIVVVICFALLVSWTMLAEL